MEKIGESNQETNGDGGLWLSKQDSRRNFGGDTPKGSIGSTPIPNGETKNHKGGNDINK